MFAYFPLIKVLRNFLTDFAKIFVRKNVKRYLSCLCYFGVFWFCFFLGVFFGFVFFLFVIGAGQGLTFLAAGFSRVLLLRCQEVPNMEVGVECLALIVGMCGLQVCFHTMSSVCAGTGLVPSQPRDQEPCCHKSRKINKSTIDDKPMYAHK